MSSTDKGARRSPMLMGGVMGASVGVVLALVFSRPYPHGMIAFICLGFGLGLGIGGVLAIARRRRASRFGGA